MKKIVFAAVLAALLIGCGDGDSSVTAEHYDGLVHSRTTDNNASSCGTCISKIIQDTQRRYEEWEFYAVPHKKEDGTTETGYYDHRIKWTKN